MNEAIQTTRGFNVIFIHSSLDDAELTPQQFRILAHISRRAGDGVAWASNGSMAKHCRMSEATVGECLVELERRQILTRELRPGKTTLWRLQPPSRWILESGSKTGQAGRPKVANNATPPKQYPPQTIPPHPPQTIPPEGDQVSVSQKKANPPGELFAEPLPFSSEAFASAWAEWLDFRAQKKKRLSPIAAKKQLKFLRALGEFRAIASLEQSMQNDWTGIFEPRNEKARQPDRNQGIIGSQPVGQSKAERVLARRRAEETARASTADAVAEKVA